MSPAERSSETIHLRLPAEELAKLDAEVARIREEAPAANVSRSTVLRHLIRSLPEPAKPKKGAKRTARKP
jgi:hypothetical protein